MSYPFDIDEYIESIPAPEDESPEDESPEDESIPAFEYEYVLLDENGQEMTMIIYEDENNNDSCTVRIGDNNYTLQDISEPIGVVLDANNQTVYLINWENDTIRPYRHEWHEEWHEEDHEDVQVPITWDDEATPVPGHYGPDPNNLPDPVTLFQPYPPASPVDFGPTLDDQLTDYDEYTDIGHAIFYGYVHEVRNVSGRIPIIYYNGNQVGFIDHNIPYFF